MELIILIFSYTPLLKSKIELTIIPSSPTFITLKFYLNKHPSMSYFIIRLNPNGEFVFEPNGKLMLTDTFNEKLKKYCNECEIEYRPSHKIRFYCASIAYDGKNLTTISKLMGHSQVATTLHYLRNVDKGNDSIQAFEHLGLRTQSNSRLACESCAPDSGLL